MRYFLLTAILLAPFDAHAESLPNTQPLTREGDLAAQMVAGIDKYLMREIAASVEKRKQFWKPDFSSPAAYAKSVQPNRERLKKILGVVDERVKPVTMELVGTTETPALVAETEAYKVFAVRWLVLPGVDGEGLLVEPKGRLNLEPRAVANIIAIPDADWTPEMLLGMSPGVAKESQYGRRLAEIGCRVLIPVLINRQDTWSGNPRIRMTNQPHREYLYRQAYQMGRHVVGYEVQKFLAAVDWFYQQQLAQAVAVIGYGEGGLVAFYAAAVDERIKAAAISGYFAPRERLWEEPIYRNVFGLLREFGDSRIGMLIAPASIVFELQEGQVITNPPPVRLGRSGAAPGGVLNWEYRDAHLREARLYSSALRLMDPHDKLQGGMWAAGGGIGHSATLGALTKRVQDPQTVAAWNLDVSLPADRRKAFNPAVRQKRQFDQLVAHVQHLMRDSERVRNETFWARLDTTNLDKYDASTQPFRKQLDEEILGKLPAPAEPMNPRSRLLHDTPLWKSYEVTLDLYPDVFASGILTVPKDLKPGEKRPVVVCQHGLEGRPTDVIDPTKRTALYNSFGSRLADKGYVVFAPQNCYIGGDKFRVLQRKANPLGLSLFSFIVRQHERILDWLQTQPFVDGERIGFYGLSYGGKTAMRVPAILKKYKCVICSGDFNEWTWINVSVDAPNGYLFCGEYEIPEFNMGHTLVYAEMAALIAPRPLMVERGHDDGCSIDEWVNYEFAKVRRLYSRLKLPDRAEIEHQAGGHECFCKGTFKFLAKHLNWKE